MTLTATSVLKRLLIVFLLVAGLYFAKDFLMPLVIGAVLATLFLPLCKRLEKKMPTGFAVAICLITLLVVISGVAMLIWWQFTELTGDMISIKETAGETISKLQQYVRAHFHITVREQSQLIKDEQPSLSELIEMAGASLLYLMTNVIFILAYFFLFLCYRGHLLAFFIKVTPVSRQEQIQHVLYGASKVSQQYLIGLMKMIGCLWIMYGVGFSLIGVKNALFFAVVCGLLELVPFIGNLTGTVLTLLATTAQGGSLGMLAGIVIVYGAVQFIQGWVLEPWILGPQVRINPLFTVISLVLGELIWGIPGVFLAIPVTAMIKIVFDHVDQLKPYGFLIGSVDTQNMGTKKNPH